MPELLGTPRHVQRPGGLVTKGAVLSEDSVYRYNLWRRWDQSRPVMVWVMLNPSTADHETDDQTITRCMGFARREHCGGIEVVNLYAFRATQPKELRQLFEVGGDPEGPWNLQAWASVMDEEHGPVVGAWGAHNLGHLPPPRAFLEYRPRAAGDQWWSLGATTSGEPRHPARLAADTPFVKPKASVR